MATIAQPVTGVDFSALEGLGISHLSSPSSFDLLELFFQQTFDDDIMAHTNTNPYSLYWTSDDNQQQPTRGFLDPSHRPSPFQQQQSFRSSNVSSNPSGPRSDFSQPPAAFATSSQANPSIGSSAPSSMNSPQSQFPMPGPVADPGFVLPSNDQTFVQGSYDPGFFNYDYPLAGERASGFVGESESLRFPSVSSTQQVRGGFQTISPISVPSQEHFSFRFPHTSTAPPTEPTLRATSSSPLQETPSFGSPSQPSWPQPTERASRRSAFSARSSYGSPIPQARDLSPLPYAQTSPRVRLPWTPQSPGLPEQRESAPELASLATTTAEAQAADVFHTSPTTLQSQFFHQSSGNFIAPLESSCRFPPPTLLHLHYSSLLFLETLLLFSFRVFQT